MSGVAENQLHVCLVGSDGVGQGALLHHCREGESPSNIREPQRESYLTTTVIDGEEYRVRLSDSCGLDGLRAGILQTAHCILCCFSVVKRETLDDIEQKWLPSIKLKMAAPDETRSARPPYILLGLQIDARENAAGEISHEEGVEAARRLGAVGYLEARMEDSDVVLSKAVLTAKEHFANLGQKKRGKGADKAQTHDDIDARYGNAPGLDHEKFLDELIAFDEDSHQLEVEMVKSNLSVLGVTPSENHAYLRCDLVDLELTSLGALRGFQQLQFVNVSKNRLRSLEPLGKLPFLLHIDASRNLLERTQTFGPPRQLETIDLSFNSIGEMGEWAVHRYLRELNLRGNLIQQVPAGAISSNKHLRMLDLSENHLAKIKHYPKNLEALFLSSNQLRSLDGIETLRRLQVLNVKKNFIKSLAPLRAENSPRLRKLCVSNNNIGSVNELEYLREFKFLCDMFLAPNPLDQLPYYRAQVLYRVPDIRFLDDAVATAEEKVKAGVIYGEETEKSSEIFTHFIPEEEWIDRRLVTQEIVETLEHQMFGQPNMVSPDYETAEGTSVKGCISEKCSDTALSSPAHTRLEISA
eukprot:GEMP01037570.1.p1 GENE.GEMP01037570.1~~GEMP01037570.1.p1  ORF type:complete len:582 (+),score=127.74 GEMP01037570.1:210-1955(+)